MPIPKTELGATDISSAYIGNGPMVLSSEIIDTNIYSGDLLEPGHMIVGPGLIVYGDTTVLMSSEDRAAVDSWCNLVIDVGTQDNSEVALYE